MGNADRGSARGTMVVTPAAVSLGGPTADRGEEFSGSARRLEKLRDLQEREPDREVLLSEADIVATRSARSNPKPGVPR